jgi:hypothetical protein
MSTIDHTQNGRCPTIEAGTSTMTRELEPQDYVTVEQAARLKGVSRDTIHTLIISGKLPSVLPNFVQQVSRRHLDQLVLNGDESLSLI